MIQPARTSLVQGNGALFALHGIVGVVAIALVTRSVQWALGAGIVLAAVGILTARGAASRLRLVLGVYLMVALQIAFYFFEHRAS